MTDLFKDYYAILGVPQSATPEELRTAYRSMSKKYHPDKNLGKDMTSLMQDINEAYAILKDERKRSLYDAEYNRFIKAKQDRQIKEEKEEKTSSYSYEYDIQDETLREDIQNAREYARQLVDEFFESLKETAKVAAKGAWEGVKYYIYMAIFLSIIGGLISTCVANATPIPRTLLIEKMSDSDSFRTYSVGGCSISYPREWLLVEHPDPISDVYIGPESGLVGFTILHFEMDDSLEAVNDFANNGAMESGMRIVDSQFLIINGMDCYKTIFQFSVGGVEQTHVSYLFKKRGVVYNVKFGGVSRYMSTSKSIIDRVINTFRIE